jgi:hypothetical protein
MVRVQKNLTVNRPECNLLSGSIWKEGLPSEGVPNRPSAEVGRSKASLLVAITYFKRFRMKLNLDGHTRSGKLPEAFRMVAWSPRHLKQHAMVKWESFRDEMDAHVFPCLADEEGCLQLMREISSRKDFVSAATWLVCRVNQFESLQPVGTIQGLKTGPREGGIQNIGVIPEFRGYGLGTVLIEAAVDGFYQAGCRTVHLEVTAENTSAIRLYERLGFRIVETVFKIADVQYA